MQRYIARLVGGLATIGIVNMALAAMTPNYTDAMHSTTSHPQLAIEGLLTDLGDLQLALDSAQSTIATINGDKTSSGCTKPDRAQRAQAGPACKTALHRGCWPGSDL